MAETKSSGTSGQGKSDDDDEKKEESTMRSPGGEEPTAGTEGPGRPRAEASRDPEAGSAAGWTLPAALERLCGQPFSDEEVFTFVIVANRFKVRLEEKVPSLMIVIF